MTDALNVTLRDTRGTRAARRMRQNGQIPAVLYGHGEKTVSLTVKADEVDAAIRHGGHLVELKGDVSESALIRDVQWDAFGSEVLHIDLNRVDLGEKVEATVVVELRGDAPGTKEGGIVQHLLHEVDIECPAGKIPEKLVVNVNELGLGESILASALELPADARLLVDAESTVVQCVEAQVEAEEGVPGEEGEPEVIGEQEEREEEGAGE